MKTKAKFDIFISHATADWELAAALRNFICYALNLNKAKVFVSSDGESLRLGDRDELQITEAHKSAKAVVALMTPNSIFRPWVIYEAGGAHFHETKDFYVVVSNGATFDCLPSPIKFWHVGNLSDRSCIDNLTKSLAKTLHRKRRRLERKQVNSMLKLASVNCGDWESVSLALVAEKGAKSPFSLESVFDERLPSSAKKDVYIIGYNFRILTGRSFKSRIFNWLRNDRTRTCCVMFTDKNDKRGVGAWNSIMGEIFEKNLKAATAELKRWTKEAKREKLSFKAMVTCFVPTAAMIVDPDSKTGFMVITPTVYKGIGAERPHFVLEAKQHKQVFDYYWYSFQDQLKDRAKPL